MFGLISKMQKKIQFDMGGNVRPHTTPNKWTLGEVTDKLGNLHFKVNFEGKELQILKPIYFLGSDSPTQTAEEQSKSAEVLVEIRVLPSGAAKGKPPERLIEWLLTFQESV